MIWPDQWITDGWLFPAAILMTLAFVAAVYSYLTSWKTPAVWPSFAVKILVLALLGICLLEPQVRTERAEPGANSVVVMVDRSQSLQLKDPGASETRETKLKQVVSEDLDWLQKLENDFLLRKYFVDQKLEATTNFDGFQADRQGSQLFRNLEQSVQRPSGKPLAGVILLTDGNATDSEILEQWKKSKTPIPPVYPVVIGSQKSPPDLAISSVVSSQSNFEAAPVTVQAKLIANGFAGKTVSVSLLSESGETLDSKEIADIQDAQPFSVQLQTNQKEPGISIYKVQVAANKSNNQQAITEATLENNSRWIVADRGRSPLRILYVSGRPNWELKYLRRAVFDDEELQLVALVRIAKREAKFDFRGQNGQESNALFRGFENQDDDTAERFDEPVFVRLGTKDSEELRGGFPKAKSELFQYDAVILDDVEAAFFTQEQQSILQEFASVRGGGVLMLGGQESFTVGKYDRTGIGEMLPVYLNQVASPNVNEFKLSLTREGWLQPWVRIHSTEKQEQERLRSMPGFKTLNPVKSIKPGATVLAQVENANGQVFPALVAQPFGRGRTAAWLLGDLWRWQLKTPVDNNDLLVYWRQTMRWLVSDVPGRCELTAQVSNTDPSIKKLTVKLLDSEFLPADNAEVELRITTPEDIEIPVTVKPSLERLGEYVTDFYSAMPGVYRAKVTATIPGSSEQLGSEIAWVSEPSIEEFGNLTANIDLMNALADFSGGKVYSLPEIDRLASELPNQKVPITVSVTEMWWHRWQIFLLGIGLLVGEWGLRRWRGLP